MDLRQVANDGNTAAGARLDTTAIINHEGREDVAAAGPGSALSWD